MKRSQGQIRLRRTASKGSLSLEAPAHPSPAQDRQSALGGDEKLFYKISEVSLITGLESYVLRYWETEFPILHPRKSRGGQRVYLKSDVETVLKIKQMLYEQGYTIAGARKILGRRTGEAVPSASNPWSQAFLLRLRADLTDILRIVSSYDREKSSSS